MTRDQLDQDVWQFLAGMFAGKLPMPLAHAAILDAADRYAAAAARHSALDASLGKASLSKGTGN